MVYSHQVENGRVEIVHVDLLVDRMPAEIVRRSIGLTALDSAARQPHGKAEGVVLAAVLSFGGRGAAELPAPDE